MVVSVPMVVSVSIFVAVVFVMVVMIVRLHMFVDGLFRVAMMIRFGEESDYLKHE